jgi:hypothetical protein
MRTQNKNVGSLITDERGDFVTKKSAKSQIREIAKGLGYTLGIFTRTQNEVEGRKVDTLTAVSDDADGMTPMTFSASRLPGAAVTCKGKGKVSKPSKGKGKTPVVEAPAKPESLADVRSLGMDQLGEFLSLHPRDGGLSAGAIRAMLTADGIEVPPRSKKATLVDMLAEAVAGDVANGIIAAGTVIIDPATGKAVSLDSIAADIGIQA